MELDIVNITMLFTILLTIIFFACTIYNVRREKKKQEEKALKLKDYMTDYNKIIRATYGLEKSREKNTGMHYDNEEIYLNRAEEIKKSSSLFIWINED